MTTLRSLREAIVYDEAHNVVARSSMSFTLGFEPVPQNAVDQARLGEVPILTGENAEYHAARERQGFIEGHIRELDDKISRAYVIDILKLSGDIVKFGAIITSINQETEENVTYQIVGADESDINLGLLSIASPLARALIGKKN